MCGLLTFVLAADACRDAPSAPKALCEQPPLLLVGSDAVDFRERLALQIALAPPDSVLDVMLTFAGAVTAEDRAQITRYGGEIRHELGSLTNLMVRFRARALGTYLAADAGRLTNASLGLLVCEARPEG